MLFLWHRQQQGHPSQDHLTLSFLALAEVFNQVKGQNDPKINTVHTLSFSPFFFFFFFLSVLRKRTEKSTNFGVDSPLFQPHRDEMLLLLGMIIQRQRRLAW